MVDTIIGAALADGLAQRRLHVRGHRRLVELELLVLALDVDGELLGELRVVPELLDLEEATVTSGVAVAVSARTRGIFSVFAKRASFK